MTYEINETHDPNLRSWVESANDPGTDFPIQNLPFCHFWHEGNEWAGIGAAIGDQILSNQALVERQLITPECADEIQSFFWCNTLDATAAGHDTVAACRRKLAELLRSGAKTESAVAESLVPADE